MPPSRKCGCKIIFVKPVQKVIQVFGSYGLTRSSEIFIKGFSRDLSHFHKFGALKDYKNQKPQTMTTSASSGLFV